MSAELLQTVCGVCHSIVRLVNSYESVRDPDVLDSLILQVARLRRFLMVLDSNEMLVEVGRGLSLLEELQHKTDEQNVQRSVEVPQVQNERGRPKLAINKEQLEYLLNLGFSCPRIAAVIGVSLSTVRRRMTEYGMSVTALYFHVTDNELDLIVSEIKRNFPNCRYRMTQGHVLRHGTGYLKAEFGNAYIELIPKG